MKFGFGKIRAGTIIFHLNCENRYIMLPRIFWKKKHFYAVISVSNIISRMELRTIKAGGELAQPDSDVYKEN